MTINSVLEFQIPDSTFVSRVSLESGKWYVSPTSSEDPESIEYIELPDDCEWEFLGLFKDCVLIKKMFYNMTEIAHNTVKHIKSN